MARAQGRKLIEEAQPRLVTRRRAGRSSGTLSVVFLTHVAQFSGAEIEVLRVIKAAEGIRATVVLAEDGPLMPALIDAGAEVIVLPLIHR